MVIFFIRIYQYTRVFDEVRKIFTETEEARLRGYKPGWFSINVKGGLCEACQGDALPIGSPRRGVENVCSKLLP